MALSNDDSRFLARLGRDLRSRRTARGESLAQIAVASGTTKQCLALTETGENELGLAKFRRLCRALGTTPAAVLEGIA